MNHSASGSYTNIEFSNRVHEQAGTRLSSCRARNAGRFSVMNCAPSCRSPKHLLVSSMPHLARDHARASRRSATALAGQNIPHTCHSASISSFKSRIVLEDSLPCFRFERKKRLTRKARVMADKPVTIRRERIGRHIGHLEDKDVARVNIALAFLTGLAD